MIDIKAKIGRGKRGYDVLMLEQGERFVPTASLYNPIEESVNIVSTLGKKELFVFIGFGSGYVFDEIIKQHPKTKIIVFEPIADVLKLVRESNYLSRIAHKITLVEGFDSSLIRYSLRNHFLPHTDFRVHVGVTANYEKCIKDHIPLIKESIEQSLYEAIGDYQTQAQFARIWLRNIGTNVALMGRETKSFKTIKNGKGALIVGAGPSSNKFLRSPESFAHHDIFSTDTAFEASLFANLNPVVVGAIDPQIHSRWHLAPWLAAPQKLIAPLTAYVQKGLVGAADFLGSAHPIVQFMAGKNSTSLKTNSGNVGAYLVRLAIELGYQEIETIGLDFSYRPEYPYLKPSYFDMSFSEKAHRKSPLSQHYEALYLGEGTHENGIIKTERLEAYRQLFIEELQTLGVHFEEVTRGHFVIKNSRLAGDIEPIEAEDIRKGIDRLYDLVNSDPNKEDPQTIALCLPNLAQKQRERLQKNENTVDTFESDMKSAYAEVCLFSQKLYEGLRYGR